MPDQQSGSDRIPTEHLARGVGAVALAAVAVIHVIDLPSTLSGRHRLSATGTSS